MIDDGTDRSSVVGSALAVLVLAAGVAVLSAQPPAGQGPAAGSRRVVWAGRAAVEGGLQVDAAGLVAATRTVTRSGDPQANGVRYVPGDVIVKFSGSSTSTTRRTAALAAGARAVEAQPFGDFSILKLADGKDPEVVAS